MMGLKSEAIQMLERTEVECAINTEQGAVVRPVNPSSCEADGGKLSGGQPWPCSGQFQNTLYITF